MSCVPSLGMIFVVHVVKRNALKSNTDVKEKKKYQ